MKSLSLKQAYLLGTRQALIDAGLIKSNALESRVEPPPAADFQQAPSAEPSSLPKPEGPLTTGGWIRAGQTVKNPAENVPVGLV